MEFYDVVRVRQSIRKFRSEPVPEQSLQRILTAVQLAPSWANTQPWELLIVSEQRMKTRLQATVPKSNPAFEAVVEAPLLIVMIGILGRSGWYKGKTVTRRGDWFMFDMGIAAEHLVLAASAEGLGTVHIGLFESEAADAILRLPEDRTIVELIPLGYPDSMPPRVKRRDLKEFIFNETYANK